MRLVKPPSVSEVVGKILGRPKRVLVVDDDPTWLSFFNHRCEGYNVTVHSCSTCAEARAELASVTFDAIFLDVRITNGTGIELYREIAAKSPSTQVAFMTGWGAENIQSDVQSIGPASIYEKNRMLDADFVNQLMHQIGAGNSASPFSGRT